MKIILRILLSPFVIIYSLFILFAGSFFPLPILVMAAWFIIIIKPIVSILNYSGANINTKSFEEATFLYGRDTGYKNIYINNFIMGTIYLWLPFYMLYIYIKEGRILKIM